MLSRAKEAMLQTSYIEFYYNEKIQDDIMLFESKHGKDLAGNIFSLLRKVTQLYPGQYRIFLTCVPDRM